MKKIVIAVAALALGTCLAHADSDFDGLYAGAEGAFGSAKIDGGDRDTAFSGSAFAGYGATYGKAYVGGEASIGVNGAKNDLAGVSVKQDLNYGATARVGYLATPKALVYGLGGWERADFDVAGSGKETLDGYKFGFGAETFVQKNMSVRSELSYTGWQGKGGLPDSTEVKTSLGLAVHF